MQTYLSHPRIVPDTVEERTYQVSMARGCLRQDSLIILPTGLGKTVVALIVISEVLEKGKKVLLLAPTKPLVDQHSMTFEAWLKDTEISVLNGNMNPERRSGIIADSIVTKLIAQIFRYEKTEEASPPLDGITQKYQKTMVFEKNLVKNR